MQGQVGGCVDGRKRVSLFQSLARFLDCAALLSNESTGAPLEMTRIEIASAEEGNPDSAGKE